MISSNKTSEISLSKATDLDELLAISKALSSSIRLNIIGQLSEHSLSITEIQKLNNISASAVIFHLDILQRAGIVKITYMPGKKGFKQICSLELNNISIKIREEKSGINSTTISQSVGVGCYTDMRNTGNWGFATVTENHLVNPRDCFPADREKAEIYWTNGGFVEYAFNNGFADRDDLYELSFSFEICSQAPGYNEKWKSDLTFYINNVELLTWTCPGDFGTRRGKLNPLWHESFHTQYGLLKTVSITKDSLYLDGILVRNDINLETLKLRDGNKILFRIANKDNAENYGGFNLFGKAFGDYPQDIVLTAVFEVK